MALMHPGSLKNPTKIEIKKPKTAELSPTRNDEMIKITKILSSFLIKDMLRLKSSSAQLKS